MENELILASIGDSDKFRFEPFLATKGHLDKNQTNLLIMYVGYARPVDPAVVALILSEQPDLDVNH